MTSREPSWADALDTILTSRLRSVHTSLPGTITAYDAAAVTATVELAVELEVTTGAYERVPPLADVPVVTPGAWSAGDKCLVVFAEEDPSKWWDTDGTSVEPPAVLARHGLHATCVPIVATAGQTVQFVALANLVQDALDKMQYAFDNHTHATAALGAPSPPIPVPAIIPPPVVPVVSLGPVAAVKVKAR